MTAGRQTHPIAQPGDVLYLQLDPHLHIRQVAEALPEPFKHVCVLLQELNMLLPFFLQAW